MEIDVDAPLPPIAARTALLFPTYNEDPDRVLARVQAIYESVEATGQSAAFDVFILSDTTDPDIFIAEEAAFLALRARLGDERVFYRHRAEERSPRKPATSPNGCSASAATTSTWSCSMPTR